MIREALRLFREYGWNVIPLWHPYQNGTCSCGRQHDKKVTGKHPLIPWKQFESERVTEDLIREWWGKWPNANIAVVTGSVSNLVVVDDDHRDGGGLRDPNTLVAVTGGGGHHYFYYTDESYPSIIGITDKVDIKGEGGYVVVPPSRHVSGGTYQWVSGSKPAPVPAEVRKWIKSTPATSPDVAVGIQKEGTRNDSLMRYVASLLGQGLSPKEAHEKAIEWNNNWNFPPLPDHEVYAAVKSLWNNKELPKRKEKEKALPTGHLSFKSTEEMVTTYGDTQSRWVIPHWLPYGTCCIVDSPPGTYKTWFMLELAISITSGRPFLGRWKPEVTGPVLIVQQEDNYATCVDRTMRLLGMPEPELNLDGEEEQYSVPIVDLKNMPTWTDDRSLSLDNPTSMKDLEEYIKKVLPVVVIVDPFFSFASLSNDYGAEAAREINTRLKPLRDEYGVSFIFAHHTYKSAGVAEASGTRKRDSIWGSNFLNASLETGWHLRGDAKGKIVEVSRHTKDAGDEPDVKVKWDIRDYSVGISVKEVGK